MASHMRGLNQHMAVQNTRKNLSQASSRPMWTSSWRKRSANSSRVYSRRGSTTRTARANSPTDRGVATAGDVTSSNFGFLKRAASTSCRHTASTSRSVTGAASRRMRARKTRWETIFQPSTARKPASHRTSRTHTRAEGTSMTQRGAGRRI